MKKNMGSIDRIVRIFTAITIAVLYYSHLINGTVAVVLIMVAGIFLLTGIVSFCPIYFPFGISTARKKKLN